ncbi:MAG: tetratricopeptide repeat protein [Syntrophobacteraceae bacterium]
MDPNPNSKIRPEIWKVLLLLAVTVLAYTSAIKGGYIWDDDMYVTGNETLKSVEGLARIWTQPQASPQYYPLVFTTFWLEHQAWGLNPFGYHLVNVLLHACVACLLCYLLLSLEVPGAWLAALVFAVHPVNVETTAWISERKNLLSGFFYMLSAIAFLRFYGVGRWAVHRSATSEQWTVNSEQKKLSNQNPPCPPLEKAINSVRSTAPGAIDPGSFLPREGAKSRRKKIRSRGERELQTVFDSKGVDGSAKTPAGFSLLFLRGFAASRENLIYYCIGFTLFVCALLSKTVTCTLPVALLLVLWWKRGRITRGEALSLAPLFAAGAGMGLMTAWLERTHVGASGADWGLGLAERFLVAGRALCFYAGKLLWPFHLSFNYERWAVDGGVWWQYLYPLAVAVVLLALWMARGRIGRGPMAAALFFAASLFPTLGFFDVFPFRYSYVADHFQYLASIGPIVLLAACASGYVLQHHRRRLALFTAAAVLVVSVLGIKTWSQGNIYADSWTLYNETLKSNPDSVLAHNNLGSLLSKQGKHDEALAHFTEALRVRPGFGISLENVSMTYYNMGVELAAQGKIDEAIERYEEALEVKPDLEKVQNNLGSLLAQKGRVEDAVRCWAKAVKIKPDYAGAHYNLMIGYTQLGDSLAARREYDRIKSLDPALAEKARSMISDIH